MKQNNDAFGQEVLAYFHKQPSYEVVERDDGFVDLSEGAPAYFREYKDWPSGQKKAIQLAKGKVLDIGAGAGRVALHLQKRGLKVVAIDNSPLAIKVCKRRGVTDAKVLSIEEIGTFKSHTFDTVIMLGNNFGLFGSASKAKRLLKKLYKITTVSALILAESVNVYDTRNPAHLAYHKLNRTRGRMAGQLRIRIRFRNYIGSWFDYLLVSQSEMRDILRGTGWRVKRFIKSDRYLYVAVIEKEK